MAEAVFWTMLALLLYSFVGYPLAVRVLAAMAPKRHAVDEGYLAPVSIVLSVYNEEGVIREKIDNFLNLDYPQERLELIVVSDTCSDRTEEIVKAFESNRIRLLVQEKRSGKTLNLNRGVSEAKGEIIVFTDANSMFDRDAVRKLVRHFADPSIGLVSGKSIYLNSANGTEETGGLYRRYEDYIKEQESRVCSIIGADGAIYALRKSLYAPLVPEHINDFIHTIQAVLKGQRAVSEPEAICREVVDETYDGEFRRQTRIMAQSWLIYLSQIGRLLAGGRIGYVWSLTSHKLLRWLTVPFMALLLVSTLFQVGEGALFQAALAAQILFFSMIACGRGRESGILRVAYMFALLHAASVLGLFKYLSGNIYTTWSPRNS